MRVLVVTGPSGGHIFPALSFLEALRDKRRDTETLLVLPQRSIKGHLADYAGSLKYISISNLKLSFDLEDFISIFNFIKGAFQSLFLLLGFRPDVVVGFGTLDCIPMVMLAWLFRIKTLIHEQNVIPGRANRLLAKFSDKVAVSFAETKRYLNISAEKIVLTGNPLRRKLKRIEKTEALSFFGFSPDKFTLLVMGGSQGSQRINQGFLKTLSGLTDKSHLQVIHISGSKDYNLLHKAYQELGIKVKLFAFFNQLEYAYSVADLAICRCGATTVAELMRFGLAAILIPYPFAYKHQLANAGVLAGKGCAVIIEDKDLDTEVLKNSLAELINDPQRIKKMRLGYQNIIQPDAAKLLVEAAL